MTKLDAQVTAHLGMIQGVIVRMGANTFALKAMAITIAAAVIALAGARPEGMEHYPLIGLLPALLFWAMDARYLHIEKCYRKLYNTIRTGGDVDSFSMDYKPFQNEVDSTIKIIFCNWSVTPFFASISLALIASYCFLKY